MNEFRFATANVYYDPLLRELYYRRLQTLVDKFYSNDQLLAKFREYADFYDADSALDIAKWPSDGSMFRERRWVEEYNIEYILKQNLTAYFRQSWLLPASQTDAERQQVFIEEANYDADSANEYIKISNNSSAHVDISDWEVEGINYIIPSGSVVPAGGSIYLLKDDIGYKASHNSVLVAGQYPSGLSNSGGQLVLNTDTGMEIDSYDY